MAVGRIVVMKILVERMAHGGGRSDQKQPHEQADQRRFWRAAKPAEYSAQLHENARNQSHAPLPRKCAFPPIGSRRAQLNTAPLKPTPLHASRIRFLPRSIRANPPLHKPNRSWAPGRLMGDSPGTHGRLLGAPPASAGPRNISRLTANGGRTACDPSNTFCGPIRGEMKTRTIIAASTLPSEWVRQRKPVGSLWVEGWLTPVAPVT